MKRIFICGNYNGNSVIEVLDNIKRGLEMAKEVLLAGHSPFCPFLDFMFHFVKGQAIPLEIYRAYCFSWIEVSDYVIALDPLSGQKVNEGVAEELCYAYEHAIKILDENEFREKLRNETL